jgi:hypothetical protein
VLVASGPSPHSRYKRRCYEAFQIAAYPKVSPSPIGPHSTRAMPPPVSPFLFWMGEGNLALLAHTGLGRNHWHDLCKSACSHSRDGSELLDNGRVANVLVFRSCKSILDVGFCSRREAPSADRVEGSITVVAMIELSALLQVIRVHIVHTVTVPVALLDA